MKDNYNNAGFVVYFPSGVCALSVDNDKNYIAYPGSSQNGEVQVFDAINLVCLKTMFVFDCNTQLLYYCIALYCEVSIVNCNNKL